METILAILMVLGIFIGIPAVIGFTIVWLYILSDRRTRRAERAKAVESITEAQPEQPAEAVAEKSKREHARMAER